ncbi:MAG: hypothetical protein ABEN55_00790 [Bradymonadaceae bacterium]
MSDDRFKEARRSLIDDDEEGSDPDQDGAEHGEDDEIAEAETQLVDLDRLAGGEDGGGESSSPDAADTPAARQPVQRQESD